MGENGKMTCVFTRVFAVLVAISLLAHAASESPQVLPPLHAAAGQIVEADGSLITLRGVNLGGWLVEEVWMLPIENTPPEGSAFEQITCHANLWSTLEKRFGQQDMLKIRRAWRDTWITKADFQRIKAAGMNSVRLPFLFDSLDAPDGLFPWIDKALAWAREVGIYVVIDLHGAPGRQSGEHHTGEMKVDRMFKEPEMIEKTAEVWKRVAARYKDHPEVAGFDLLNEPTGSQNDSTLYLVYDRLYRAVRSVAPDKMVFMEDAYKGIQGMPYPAVVGWTNVVFSQHSYNFAAKNTEDHAKNLEKIIEKMTKARVEREVPVYIGEFNIEPYATGPMMKKYVDEFDAAGISWSLWTYKSAMRGGGGGMWGWFRAPRTIPTINPYTDSPDQILEKIAGLKTENLEESPVKEAFLPAPAPQVVAKEN